VPTIKRKGIYKRREESIINADIKSVGKLSVDKALNYVSNTLRSEGYRERTINDYAKLFGYFTRDMNISNVAEITESDVRGYINLILTKGLSNRTANIRLAAFRAIFKRLFEHGIIPTNPPGNITKLREDEQKIFTLNDKQVHRLFSVVEKDTFAGFRDYCAMLLMLTSGLRSNEVNSLEISDIDFDNLVIMLPGAKNKNRRTRAIPITKKVADELRQLIAETSEYFNGEIKHVFTNQFGEALDNERIRKRMHKYGTLANLYGECRPSPHSLRHTFATNFLKNGGNITALMKILGHSDIKTTQRYLYFTDDDIKEQFNKADSLSKLNLL
jgi:site-specific recombinase XerD